MELWQEIVMRSGADKGKIIHWKLFIQILPHKNEVFAAPEVGGFAVSVVSRPQLYGWLLSWCTQLSHWNTRCYNNIILINIAQTYTAFITRFNRMPSAKSATVFTVGNSSNVITYIVRTNSRTFLTIVWKSATFMRASTYPHHQRRVHKLFRFAHICLLSTIVINMFLFW